MGPRLRGDDVWGHSGDVGSGAGATQGGKAPLVAARDQRAKFGPRDSNKTILVLMHQPDNIFADICVMRNTSDGNLQESRHGMSSTARLKKTDPSRLPLLLGGIIGAMTLWPMSYTTLNNSTSTVALGWAIFCTIAGLYLGAVTARAISQIASLTCGGVAIALAIRIVVDCAIDPTNHNLWPFEFVWMGIVCFPTSWLGGLLGRKLLSQR